MRHKRAICTALLTTATLLLLCACTNGQAPVSTDGTSSGGRSAKSGRYVVGDGIRIEDITEFYFTHDSSAYPPAFQRYHFYVEDGAYLFSHETREGDHWPLTEDDIIVSGSKKLTEEEWNVFFDYLKNGSVEKRTDDARSGGSGPWLYLYWNGDRSEYQVFTFASYKKQMAFEEYCIELKNLSSFEDAGPGAPSGMGLSEMQTYLDGAWILYGRGNPTRLTPLLVMEFASAPGEVTILRPDEDTFWAIDDTFPQEDCAVCYGTYETEQLTFADADGAWVGLLHLSFQDIPEDFSGELFGHPSEADGYFVFYTGKSRSADTLYLSEAINVVPDSIIGTEYGPVSDAIFGTQYGLDGDARFVFGKDRDAAQTGNLSDQTEQEHKKRKREVFYGFVWEDEGDAVYVQYVDVKRFSYDLYGQELQVLCPVPQENISTVRYPVAGMEEMAHQPSYSCRLYRMETDADGVIIDMKELTPYGGEMAGLYKEDET